MYTIKAKEYLNNKNDRMGGIIVMITMMRMMMMTMIKIKNDRCFTLLVIL